MCSLASHLLIFRRQLGSVLGGEEEGRKDPLGLEGKGTGAGHRLGGVAGNPAGQAYALAGRQLPGTAVKSRFPWSPSLLVPSPDLGRRSKQPWKTVSISDPEIILLPWGDISLCSSPPFPIIT